VEPVSSAGISDFNLTLCPKPYAGHPLASSQGHRGHSWVAIAPGALAVSLVSDAPAFQGLVLAFSLAEIVLASVVGYSGLWKTSLDLTLE